MADPTPATNPVLNFLSKFSPLLLLLLGGLLTQLWNRFRTRTRRFAWKASHRQIAIAANHPQLGTVTVQHNGVPVNHVHMTTVEFTNDSNEDQKDVPLTLSFQGVGHILNSTGFLEGTLGLIPFDPDYVALYVGANPDQINALNTYVVHKLPVFNRRQKAIFNLLVLRDDASVPVVLASCNHPGVRLDFLPTGQLEVDGMPYGLAVGSGVLLTVAALMLTLRFQRHPHPYMDPFLGWLLGLYSARIGAAGLNTYKAVVRIVG
jgi:hypothetical protein